MPSDSLSLEALVETAIQKKHQRVEDCRKAQQPKSSCEAIGARVTN
ncbi:MAG: hypothetical protein H8K07_09600 [Nitrospira sp.]|nr:hypothetical protein [Nitrospira sp.]MDI3462693.1 hypothetical protein [Nitrospira sp.]